MGLFGTGGLFGKGKLVKVTPKEPDAPPVVGVVTPPATNAGLRIFHTAWQLLGGVVCAYLAKKYGYVTTPADAEKVGVATVLVLTTIKNIFVAIRTSKASAVAPPVVPAA